MARVTKQTVEAVARWMAAEASRLRQEPDGPGFPARHNANVAAAWDATAAHLREAAWFASPSLLSRILAIVGR